MIRVKVQKQAFKGLSPYLPEGLAPCPAVIEPMLWMLYCEEAIINFNNYGGAVTFDLAISGEKKEMIVKKGRRQRIQSYHKVFRKSLSTLKIQ